MSRELQVKLEVLKLHPVQSSEEGETSQTLMRTARPASAILEPMSTISPASRPSSVMGTLVSREVSTKFNQYHIVPMHNSTAEDGKQNHTTGLVILRNQDSDETDLEVVEIVAGTALMSPTSGPEEREMSPENVFDASDKPLEIENYGPNEPTLPAANTFTAIHSDNEWLKQYIPDDQNSQIGNMQNKIEVTTEDGEKWYRLRIPYLFRFYNTEGCLVGQENDCINTLKGEEKRWCVLGQCGLHTT